MSKRPYLKNLLYGQKISLVLDSSSLDLSNYLSFVFFVQMKKDVKQKNESFVFKYYQNQIFSLLSQNNSN